ncbi:uncharacterized protein MAM_02861 [Metarhizium album ARSEF 1941]|uniref:TIGR02453 family protein n=1 Tax=Metarhizium album (strain ARSEF 1941) TaxID=1081103 RepID=A0A0B2WYP5_METAS|nr:uncharacterized protein MAM_02861 [Metarhizium album ARSEF 1941]KHN99163.1 hypothetical protein MAM_02861 [Metarhizium album ARSEF 1941]
MPSRKRSAPEPSTDRRRSGRLSTASQKSSYFEDSDTPSNEDEAPLKKQRRLSGKSKSTSKQLEEDQYVQETADEDQKEEEEEAADDDDDDEAPRRVEIIPLEKMRDTGGVEYEDHKLHKNTLLFLKDLKANNKRSWLKSHDGEYRRALKDWQSFVETATQTIIEVDETVPELPIKDVIFRIYRDIRFSKVKTPYKPHFSAAWSRTGRKGPYACYYMHCEPGSSFIGGGLWHPEAAFVTKLRRSIDRHPDRWRRTFSEPLLKKFLFPNVKANAGPEAVIKAFVQRNQENALKKRPMGYEVTHRDIELLKLRNYTIGAKIDADMFTKDTAQHEVQEIVRGIAGFVSFLNSIIMPDPAIDGDGGSDDDDDDDGDELEEQDD